MRKMALLWPQRKPTAAAGSAATPKHPARRSEAKHHGWARFPAQRELVALPRALSAPKLWTGHLRHEAGARCTDRQWRVDRVRTCKRDPQVHPRPLWDFSSQPQLGWPPPVALWLYQPGPFHHPPCLALYNHWCYTFSSSHQEQPNSSSLNAAMIHVHKRLLTYMHSVHRHISDPSCMPRCSQCLGKVM